VSSVLLGAAFIAAGVFKLLDGPAWPRQAADIGVARPLAVSVPWVELGLGVLLVLPVVRPWPAVVALVLLIAFTVVIVRRLLDGSRPPCACFGSRSNRPLGPIHVLRNLGLMALAALSIIWA
jgi:hypothetical protein